MSGQLEFIERPELPGRTIIAPIEIAREIRLLLPQLNMTIVTGLDDVVYASTDICKAFNSWQSKVIGLGDPSMN